MRATMAMFAAAAILFVGVPGALAKDATKHFSGQIKHIDSAAKTLAVKREGMAPAEMTFAVEPDAKIMSGAKTKSLGELWVGEHVNVSYADVGSEHEAQRIEVVPARTTGVKPHPKPSAK